MKRVTLHWTAGAHYPNAIDRASYHFLVAGNGDVIEGNRPPEANRSPLGSDYVRHCGGFNSDNIGVALCGMQEARERPFSSGPSPITGVSYNAAIQLVADLCETYRITPSRQTVFLHSEVRPRWGRGKYKWDVNWIPGLAKPGDPVEMGDAFRARVVTAMRQADKPDLWARLLQHFGRAA